MRKLSGARQRHKRRLQGSAAPRPGRGVVIFDIYKTLIGIKTDEDDEKAYAFLADWLSYKGLPISPQVLRDRYKAIIRKEIESSREPHPDVEIGDIFRKVVYGDAVRAKVRHGSLPAEAALLFRMFTTKSITHIPDAIAVLRQLRNEVRLAVVSNSQRLFTMPELVKFDLARYFEYILFSSDVKTCKPDPAIFRKALAELKVKPGDALYVGDDLLVDVAGAQQVGMKTIWINHAPAALVREQEGGAVPDAEVTVDTYRDLPDRIREILI